MDTVIEKNFKITAETGIHARPATILVNEAIKYDCDIDLKMDTKLINLKSIMGVMSLGIYSGEVISIICNGTDEENAMNALTDVFFEMKLGREI